MSKVPSDEMEQFSVRASAVTLTRFRRDLAIAGDAIGNRNWALAVLAIADVANGAETFIPVLATVDELCHGRGQQERLDEANAVLQELLTADALDRFTADLDEHLNDMRRRARVDP